MSDAIAGSARGWSALATDPRALARVIESAPYAAVLYRVDGDSTYRVVALNDPAAVALDHPAIEVLGLTLGEMVDGDELAMHTRRYDDVVRTKEPVEYSIEAATGPDNAVCRCRFRVSPVSDDLGDVAYLFGTWWDVTDEEPTAVAGARELQIALTASEARVHESDARLAERETQLANAHARLQAGEELLAESATRLQDADTRLQEAEARSDHLSEAEALAREREERSRALIQNAPDMMLVLDETGFVLDASPSVQRILGLDPADWAEHSIFELVHPDDKERVLAAVAQNVADGEVAPMTEFRLRAGDGTWRVLEATSNNRYDDPAVGGLVVNVRDITDRRHLEDALGEANKLEAVGRLATSVANDFDHLIGTITARAQRALAAVPDDSNLRSDLEELAGAAARATSLVGQLLTLGRRPAGPVTLVDVGDVVRSMEPMLRQMLGPAVGLACGGPRIPVWVSIDHAALEQIVMNLVVNAGDACASEGGQIVVRTTSITVGDGDGPETPEWADLPSGRYVILSIHDDGAGMDENTEAQALEPFFTTRPGQSTGLGLSIVHGIVVSHGGRLAIETALGDGTTVRIALPETVPVTDDEAEAPADHAAPASTS